jgi:kynurenine formamidase
VALPAETLGAEALERPGNIEALGIDATSVGSPALVHVDTLRLGAAGVTRRADAGVAAVGVDTLGVDATGRRLTLVNI